MRILQIANYREGGGGISVQVKLLQDLLRRDGYPCDILSSSGSVAKRVKAVIWLLSKGRRYDVFHIHACSNWGFFPAIVGIPFGKLFHKKIVLTYHGGGAERFLKRRKLVRRILKRTDFNIALSGFTGGIFDQYQIPYVILPNIVELSGNHFRQRKEIGPKFISTRAFEYTYNIECTLRAFKIVQRQYPHAQLTLVGGGSFRYQLESFILQNDIENVMFTGRVCNDSIYNYLDKADIMISSSRADNMPVSILEGFNAGLLVIASRVGGVPYIVDDGVSGLLFENDNSGELAEKMVFALQHQDESLQMTIKAKESLSNYQWDTIKDKLFGIYNL